MYDKPIIKIGSLEINLYGICFAIGIIVCLVLMLKFTKKKGMTPQAQNFFYFTAIASIIVGYFFAALFQSIYDYIENPSNGFHLFDPNYPQAITFLGGLIGGAGCFLGIYYGLARVIYKDKEKYMEIRRQFPILLEFAPCGILIAHAFGRIGCFFAGCCYGAHTDSWLGIEFPGGGAANSGKVFPTQLFEAIFLFAMFAVCTVLYFKDIHINMAVYMGSYGLWRFLIEFLRDDHRGEFVGALTPSQFWSILLVVGAIALIVLRVVLKKKKNYDLWV